ncbi:uncharacterized protein B0P05DRAFT_569969 [Gilbertella persicaria]|uniref:uncharacterized protein n=1 Tax=Gilbertella persicaria TaxID=101096 RepID=UPI00221E39CE|nr:uncharacterized protein B0P05DRAFT_569969 [Gilbertella persicaria]KAI8085752.1 hypothetical protein B0P05DRAFT_569969 [Gilbertella persicaria]
MISKSSTTLLSNPWCPQQQQQSPPLTTMDSHAFLNLEKVVQTYGDQPELLELILSSKVEEDRRRAEEAKLRRKEIDYVLHKQQSKKETSLAPIQKPSPPTKPTALPRLEHYQPPTTLHTKRKNSSSIEMLLSPSPRSDLKLPEIQTSLKPIHHQLHCSDHPAPKRPFSLHRDTLAAGSAPVENEDSNSSTQKRRRREMQAITTIIETREFPYNDDYLWKNNGNTVHKKTGFKSIYYKCSNSAKGCPVNKTVTFKDNGEHLIKYRGQHLSECNRIKRITDL